MSFQFQQFDRLARSDPALRHFPIQLREYGEENRWELRGQVPVAGLKKRAGLLARGLAPPHMWLVNDIVIRPDEKMRTVAEWEAA